jgi:hypothetical protein
MGRPKRLPGCRRPGRSNSLPAGQKSPCSTHRGLIPNPKIIKKRDADARLNPERLAHTSRPAGPIPAFPLGPTGIKANKYHEYGI